MIISIILHFIFYKSYAIYSYLSLLRFYTSNALFGQNTKQNQKYKALCYIWWSHIQYI